MRIRRLNPVTLTPADRDRLLRLALHHLDNNGQGCGVFEEEGAPGVWWVMGLRGVRPSLADIEPAGRA